MNQASRTVRTLLCSTILLACSGSTNSSSHDSTTGGVSGGGQSNSGSMAARGGLSGVGGTAVTAGGSPSDGGAVAAAGGGGQSTSATNGGAIATGGITSSQAGSIVVATSGGSSSGGTTASIAGASTSGAPTNGGTSTTMGAAGSAGARVHSGGAAAKGGATSYAGTSGYAGTAPGSAGAAATGGGTSTCEPLRILSLGMPGTWGCQGDMAILEPWVNTTTNARLTSMIERTTITPELLAHYDVVITQELGETNTGPFWTFSQQEKDALAQWVTAGGGLMTLQGYSADPSETASTNQLLEFATIAYNADSVLVSCAALDLNCYCWGLSIPFGGLDPTSPIWTHVKNIPISIGRSIKPGTATVIASDATSVYAATKTVGAGRVFAFADDWVTYQSQWETGCMPAPTSTADPCYGNTAADKYRMSQFWYNALRWLGGAKACDLRVSDPTVVL